MAVVLRGSITTVNGIPPLTVTTPTGLVSGDVIVVWCITGNATAAAISGFTAVTPTAQNLHENLLYRTANGTEGVSFSLTGPTTRCVVCCAAFSGAAGGASFWDPSTPVGASSATTQTSVNFSIAGLENSASKATTVNGDMLLVLVETNYSVSGSGVTAVTWPSGFAGSWSNDTTAQIASMLGWKAQATAGTTGTLSGSLTGTTGTTATCTQAVAIQAVPPAVSGTATLSLGPLTTTSTGTITGTGTATLSLGPLTLTTTGTVLPLLTGTASLPLGPLTTTTVGIVLGTLNGTASLPLGPLTTTVTGVGIVAAQLPLGPLTLTTLSSLLPSPHYVTTVTTADASRTSTPTSDRPRTAIS